MIDKNRKPEGQEGAPVFLIGFMGAGKTTVGRILAQELGYEFFDLDQLIEAKAGKSVSTIFAESGEDEFRRLERDALASCQNLRHTVVALGGGCYVAEANRAILRRIGKTVWLDCSLEVCLSRISGDMSRPLLRSEGEMRSLLDSRRPIYAMADYVVDSGSHPPEAVALKIAALLGR